MFHNRLRSITLSCTKQTLNCTNTHKDSADPSPSLRTQF